MCSDTYEEIVAATAADEGFVVPIAATVRSAIDCLANDQRLCLFVLDGGITPASRERLKASWADSRVRIEWLSPDVRAVEHLPVSHHINATSYLRLLLPEILPRDVGKMIYFDADMLIRHDLGQLFAEPLGDDLALAVREMAAPWIDAQLAAENYSLCQRYLAAARPISNYRELGMRPDAWYFNAGMFVFDAARWRSEGIAKQTMECLQTHREHVLWWDQYALNVVLAGRWRPLDMRWNQTAWAFEYPSWRESPLSRDEFEQLQHDPWIVHFCSPSKPWHYFCDHPYRQEFLDTLSNTAWRDWRPRPPANTAAAGWKHYRRMFRKRVKSAATRAWNHFRRAA